MGLRSDATEIKRKTGTVLDLLGICGGLLRALTAIISIVINPYTLYALESYLAVNLVRFVPSSTSEERKKKKKKDE